MSSVQISNLYKTYKGNSFPSIDGLELQLAKGQIHGILGPNGAGKTSLIKILTGLLVADDGEVFIDGLDISKNRNKIKRKIGLIPQDIALYQNLTAYENLNYFASQYKISKLERKTRIDGYLKEVDLFDRRNDLIKNFSGGMKRRINLIASLLHGPELIILDEPTVGTDVQSKQIILEMLERLNKNGVTIIYTSHLMDEAEQICDQIYIINHGKIIKKGSPEELIQENKKNQKLEDVFVDLTSEGN